MTSTAYHSIDKNIIQKETAFEFDIYTLLSKKEVQLFKEKNSIVTDDDENKLHNIRGLYVMECDYTNYKNYYQTIFLPLEEQRKVAIHKIKFNEQAAIMYQNASKVLQELFENPETLGHYEASKEVVNNLVGTILDDNFAIQSLIAIANHDYYTHTHSINVAVYSLALGSFIGLKESELSKLGEAALLHDLGKSQVDADIINKNGKLSDKEFEEMKQHPNRGYKIALKLGIKDRYILSGIRHHHEKMDGTGYPMNLKGESVPRFARIIGLCDIFDALTTKRSYKDAMSTFDALKLIRSEMKNHVDLELLDQLIAMFK